MYVFRRSIITAAALLLTGCAAADTDTTQLDRDFRCSVSVSGERRYSAELERVDRSGWKVMLTAPESAKGMELDYMSDGKVTVTVQGHTIVYTRSDIPDAGVFDLITAAADMCIENKGVTSERSSSGTVTKGELRGLSFAVQTRQGSISSLELGSRIKAEFSYLPSETVSDE